MSEQWRAVVGHQGYEVSSHGRVRSLDRVLAYERDGVIIHRRHRGRLLSAGTTGSGHLLVVLGRRECVYVHHLVLEAFIGPAPSGTECCHWDDNPANNHSENLRWGTRADNLSDFARNHGRHQQERRT